MWLLGLVGFGGLTFLGLCLIEVLLRTFGFGYDTRFLIPFEESGQKYYRDNPKFFWRYMGRTMARNPMPTRIPQQKGEDTIRILILGESAALGDPVPAYGFPRFLEVLLGSKFPEKNFEIVNTATTAINSHVIRDIAKECIKLDADYWIGYLGNNEYLGPFGPGSVFAGGSGGSYASIRLGLMLRKFRIGQLIDELILSINTPKNGGLEKANWQGMEMFSNKSIPLNDPGRLKVQENLQKNLKAIGKSAQVAGSRFLLTPAVANLRTCGPFAWTSRSSTNHTSGLSDKILAHLRGEGKDSAEVHEAVANLTKKDIKDAAAYFYSGILKEKDGDFSAAKMDFQMACDYDLLPFRMPSSLRQAVLDIQGNENFTAFDPQPGLESAMSKAALGDETFYEHVHLRPQGNFFLALQFASQIANDFKSDSDRWMGYEECVDELAMSGYDEFSMAKDMLSRIQSAPLSHRPLNELNIEGLLKELSLAGHAETQEDNLSRYQEAIKKRPDDWLIRQRYALYLDEIDQSVSALEQVDRIIEIVPHSPVTHFQRGIILNQINRVAEAKEAFTRSLELRPSFAEARLQLAWIDWKNGNKEQAEEGFKQAARLDPGLESPQLAILVTLKEAGETQKFWDLLQRMAVHFPHSNNVASELYIFGSQKEQRSKVLTFLKDLHENGEDSLNRNLPGNSEVFTSYGKLLQLEGQLQNAKKVYEQTGRKAGNINSLYMYGIAAAMSNEMEDAIECFSRVIKSKPDFWPAYFNYGVALAKVGRYTEAYSILSNIPESDSNHMNARNYMSEILRWDSDAAKPVKPE